MALISDSHIHSVRHREGCELLLDLSCYGYYRYNYVSFFERTELPDPSRCTALYASELSMGWVDPRVGFGWVGSGMGRKFCF